MDGRNDHDLSRRQADVLKMVKVGDHIMATVYDGDMTLHNVMAMPPEKSDKQKSKK